MYSQPINLISDTVTKPTPPMLEVMMHAEVGDDVFGQDPTTNALEEKMADMFGHEAALFCPSGTMTNQIAIKAQTQPLDEILCDELSHIYRYELGGYGFHSGVAIHVMRGKNGIISSELVDQAVKPKADWNPTTKLLCIENSVNMGGGNYYTLKEIEPIANTAKKHQLKMHLDGARLFNVLVETGETPKQYGDLFDSVSICLSKGLGAPVGSVLTGTKNMIAYARRVRKVMGGGMRQCGYLAAAGIYALDHHVDRLKEDHRRARLCGQKLETVSWVKEVFPVFTNIVIFQVADHLDSHQVVSKLASQQILCAPVTNRIVRWVFHLDIDDEMTDYVVKVSEGLF
ncbi:MAG TPA: GntG family PLP-dependent aldolase [Saprospiraceae bacterium]|nr:GntG family PLP-dependent aldolase [Saprospiraceae bacterium]